MNQEMQYIYEVYKEGSFSKAARKLFLTQPALSISIRKVEEELGMPLFDRRHNPLSLTQAGEIYIQKIKKIMQLEEDLYSEISDIADLRTGHLRLGGTNYVNSYVLPPVISLFVKKYPGIKISLTEASSNDLIKLLEDDQIDLTFSCGSIDPENFSMTPAFRDKILLAVPRNYIDESIIPLAITNKDVVTKAYTKPSTPLINLNLFANIPFVLLRSQNNLYQRSMKFFSQANIEPIVIHELDQLVTCYHFCRQGIGATFIGSLLVSAYQDPNVLYFCIDSSLTMRSFYTITKKNRYVSIATKEFIKVMAQVYTP